MLPMNEIKKWLNDSQNIKILLSNLLWYIIIPCSITFFVTSYLISPIRIDGRSMAPTIEGGSLVFVLKTGDTFDCGDIILFIPEKGAYSGAPTVKRIIGKENQVVVIEGRKVYVDGHLLTEDYAFFDTDCEPEMLEFLVPEGHYFVMGDNRCHSIDSRHEGMGFIPINCIVGKIVGR